jgi:predicted Zn-dependent peptidase
MVAVVAVAALVGAAEHAAAAKSETVIVKRRLGNGVTLIVSPNPWNSVAAVSVLVDAGSKHDPVELRGLARVTSELLTCGTATMPRAELESLVDSRGIRLGSYTTEDLAEIYAASTIDQFDAALDVLAALVTQPSFDGRDLPRAQRRVLDEQERAVNDPFESCYAKLNELMLGDHPYAHPPCGTKAGVSAVTRDDVMRFHADRYRGGNIVVAAVGDFDVDEVMRKLGESFAPCASGRSSRRATEAKPSAEPVAFEFHRDIPTGYVAMGFLAPPMGSDDCAAVRVLSSVLGEGKSDLGRLRAAFRVGEPDGAAAAGAFCSERVEIGRLVLFASTKGVDEAAATIMEVVERIREEGVPDDEVAAAKERLLGQIALSGQPNLERARLLATGEIARLGSGHTDDLVARIGAVTAADVHRVAGAYLTAPSTVILRPGRAQRTQL